MDEIEMVQFTSWEIVFAAIVMATFFPVRQSLGLMLTISGDTAQIGKLLLNLMVTSVSLGLRTGLLFSEIVKFPELPSSI